MPILPQEPDVYPDDLLDEDRTIPEGADAWWAVYTMARREKDLMRRLRAVHVAHYGPMIKRRTRSPSGRHRESFVPLFAGYVFLNGGEEQRYQALETNCISQCLPVKDTVQLVQDLRQIRKLIHTEAPLTPEARIKPGMRVRIRSGPMMGLEGMVDNRRGGERLYVSVQFLQQGVSVSIEDCEVERID